MKEYLVHIWGGAWNDDANPSIEKDYGIKSGYHYFNDIRAKNKFIRILNSDRYLNQGLMIDEQYGEMTHKRTIFCYTVSYNDKTYDLTYDFGYEYTEKQAITHFTQGDFGCDCNLSLFIQQEYGEDEIDFLNCGELIKIESYYFKYED